MTLEELVARRLWRIVALATGDARKDFDDISPFGQRWYLDEARDLLDLVDREESP